MPPIGMPLEKVEHSLSLRCATTPARTLFKSIDTLQRAEYPFASTAIAW